MSSTGRAPPDRRHRGHQAVGEDKYSVELGLAPKYAMSVDHAHGRVGRRPTPPPIARCHAYPV